MIEVEVKAHANDLTVVEDKLNKLGAFKKNEEYQEDTYFNAPHRDFAQTDEALRIRKTCDNDGERTFITYKGAKIDKVSKTRKEIEVDVGDPLKVANIFKSLGFWPVAIVKKNRVSYIFNELIITLDEVQGVGSFVEIEKEAEEDEDFQDALNEIFRFYEKIGIKKGFERRSYLELMKIH
jgi:adenylate cyclase, class 2